MGEFLREGIFTVMGHTKIIIIIDIAIAVTILNNKTIISNMMMTKTRRIPIPMKDLYLIDDDQHHMLHACASSLWSVLELDHDPNRPRLRPK